MTHRVKRPLVGQPIFWRGTSNIGDVLTVQGDVCVLIRKNCPGAGIVQWFLWRYPDGQLNPLFDWSTKTRPCETELLCRKLGLELT